ncbi:hypothetical protein EGW08_020343 [Elysia chlorotica]|uniref:EGF-like domain-containing protein n=1 Tax=Elysia chlorotica TaxID=188477 RepID=A0A433SRK7_ELYCH|nr:hypothetical protein EGW08_020343 [Elysia chlorotica]
MHMYEMRLTIWSLLVMTFFLGACLAGHRCESECLNGGSYYTWGELAKGKRICMCSKNFTGPCCELSTFNDPHILLTNAGASGLNPPAAISCLLLAGFLCRLPGLLWGR